MKIISTFCLIAVIMSASQASLLHDVAQSGLEALVNSGLKMVYEKSMSQQGLLGNMNVASAYQLIRDFVKCDAGVSTLADTIFTVVDLGESDTWSWQVIVFGILYLYSWYQQNFSLVYQECMALSSYF